MLESAKLKIERSRQFLSELQEHIAADPPFYYVERLYILESKKTIRACRNEPSIERAAIICGDLVHNLRSALDHAYWSIVSPHVPADKRKEVQFPFAKSEQSLPSVLKKRFADRAGQRFYRQILELKPHKGSGGNDTLATIDGLDITDKHKFLPILGDFVGFDSNVIKKFTGFDGPNIMVYGVEPNSEEREIVSVAVKLPSLSEIRSLGVEDDFLDRPSDQKCDLLISVGGQEGPSEVVKTMRKLISGTEIAILLMEAASKEGGL